MDNTTCHRARITIAQFQGNNIELLNWPVNSLDLNLIEGVWNQMKAQIAKQKPCPTSKEAMQAVIQSEWENLEACFFENLVASMPACLQAVIEVEGGPTK